MKQNDYFEHGTRAYPPDVCEELAFYFDSDEVRDRMLCAHIVLEARIADAAVWMRGLEGGCALVGLGELDGLCLALRTISGTKYLGVDFTDPAWVEEHRSKP